MELQVVQGRQTAAGSMEMLQRASLLTEGPRLCGDDWVFQQDNADHPACSPDLNHIENVWGLMARKVYKNGREFLSVDALLEAILTTWSNVPNSLMETLGSSMPKRFFYVQKPWGYSLLSSVLTL